MSRAPLQRIHHYCNKLKQAFLAHHTRTMVHDTPVYRSLSDILMKQGFISAIQPGDVRGPFQDRLSDATRPHDLLDDKQKERVQVLLRMRDLLEQAHAKLGSQGQPPLKLPADWHHQLREPRFSVLARMPVLPPVGSVTVPLALMPQSGVEQPLTPAELRHVTCVRDRRLWLSLRYDEYDQPSMSDMHLVSKGSRRVYTDAQELTRILSGQVYNRWGSSMVGSVTVLHSLDDGRWMTAEEALKAGCKAEVVCVAK